MTPDLRTRYLALLGLDPEPPSVPALTRLVTAHLARFPFENVSKLVRAARGLPPGLPNIDEFLQGAARDGTGGTCYLQASCLNTLLRDLGYAATLAGADMDQPDVHLVNIVTLAGRPWLVDVGYGAPFFAPMPLDATEPVTVNLGRESYSLHPAAPGTGHSRLDHLRDGAIVHGYTVKRAPRRLEEFAAVVADSFRPESSFVNRLRIVRHTPERSVSLRDFSAEITAGTACRTVELAGRETLLAFSEVEFGIRRAVAAAACDALAARGHGAFARRGA